MYKTKMVRKHRDLGIKEMVIFPTLTILNDKSCKEKFPKNIAISWAIKNMRLHNDYDNFFIDYFYPAYDSNGNEIERYKVRLLANTDQYAQSDVINETII